MHEELTEIHASRDFNPEISTGARFLLHALGQFELIIGLCLTRYLRTHFKNVTIALQGVDMDIVTWYKMILTVKDTLQVIELEVHAW